MWFTIASASLNKRLWAPQSSGLPEKGPVESMYFRYRGPQIARHEATLETTSAGREKGKVCA